MSEINKLEERFELLNSDELVKIQQEYRKKKLKETLMGPLISTAVHLLLIFAVSFFRGEVKKQNPQIVITQKVIEVPDKPVEPEPLPKKLDEPIFEEIENPVNPSDSVVDEIPMIEDEQVEEPPAVDEVQGFDFPDVLKPSTSTLISTSEYLLRSPKEKQKARRTHSALEGGTKSLLKALDWLAKNQRPDGSWGNSGVTGLALLAYLANGDTPQSKRYGKTVGNAIKWLASSSPGASLVDLNRSHSGIQIVGVSEFTQKDFAYYAGGEVSGTGDIRVAHGYPHAIKVYALAEAYMMTQNYSLERPLKAFAKLLIKGQKAEGDFDYNYKKGPRWDNSISFWNYQALKALKSTSLDFDGLDDAIEKAIPRMKLMAKYHFPYSGTSEPRGGRGNTGLAAAGALCLQLLGAAKGDSFVDNIMDRLRKEAVPQMDWNNSPKKWVMYAWYYQTFAMFQHGGKHWKEWNSVFQKVLIEHQHPEGYWAHELAWGAGKNIEAKSYQTAMAALMFTVYFRYGVQSQIMKLKTGKRNKIQNLDEDLTIDIF